MGKTAQKFRCFWSKITGRPWNFSWVINNKLAGCCRPESMKDMLWLKSNGVKSIVNLTEYPLPDEWINKAELDYLHEPIEDHMPPTVKQIEKIIFFITNEISNDHPVVVHCAAGQGRTGTILASYFIKHQGFNVKESIKKIRKMRYPSIERSQEISLYQYEQHLYSSKWKETNK